MRRFFNILLGALAMIAVALLSAFITMRLAIHGREVEVPNLAGMTMSEANNLASSLGLNLNIENHFYSTVTPAGRVLSQYPAPGTKVRREWVMRITESIGPQKVSVPNVIGKTEREATVTIRRLSLDLGTVAYIAAPGQAGIVLSQTPTPAAAGVDGPRISLLVSEPAGAAKVIQALSSTSAEDRNSVAAKTPAESNGQPAVATDATSASASTASDAASTTEAYVMPNLVGLSLSAASSRVASMGLHIGSVEVAPTAVRSVAPISAPTAPGSMGALAPVKPLAPIAPITLANTVIAQTPAAGQRVTKADKIHVTLSR